MKLLLLCTAADQSYFERFSRLAALVGHKVLQTTTSHVNPVTLDVVAEKHGIDAILCAQQPALEAILRDTSDWVPPPTKKKITLDDFAGSMLKLRSGREVVILNPLERLRTIPFEKFVVNRYVSKLTQPDKWFKQTEFQWKRVTSENQHDVLARLSLARLVAIDIETPWPQDDLRTMRCVSYTAYFPDTHTTESYVVGFDNVWEWQFIRAANANPVAKVFQNGLFDNAYFLRWGCPVNNWLHDTFHLFHSWLSELPKRLDFIAPMVLRNVRYWKDDGKTGGEMDLHRYCALDGWSTINGLLAILAECPHWAVNNYCLHEFPMVFPAMHAAMEGWKADEKIFESVRAKKQEELAALRKRIQYLVAEPNFNPGSPDQMANLFRILGVDASNGTGKIPTLKAMAASPLAGKILELCTKYKGDAKLLSNYLDPSCIWNGRIFYSLNPGKTDTLRAASEASAFDCGNQIQNIPRGDAIKQFYMADDGWLLCEPDKAQSEARCVGYLSGEEALISLVESSHDYHAWNAAAFFGVPYEQIYDEIGRKTLDKILRDLAKRTNHGANYNMGAGVMLDTMGPALVAKAKISLKLPASWSLRMVCEHLLRQYDKTYPAVRGRWYQHTITQVETTGMLVSPFGWVRKCFGAPRDNKQQLNSIVAHAPQNLSVACVNREWYKIWRATVYGDLVGRVRVKAQIHDSIPFQYRIGDYAAAQQVQAMMNTRVKVKGSDGKTREMYIPTDLGEGKQYWSELK